jgi:D-alanyl-D-alanine carboxypeptidase
VGVAQWPGMWRRLFCLSLVASCALCAQDLASQADAFVRGMVEQKRFQGSVLLAREGKPLFRKSYGLANAEWDAANTPDTKFRLGSITKQFTSALILQLAEQGKLRLDDSVLKYYTEGPKSWQPVTIHHLLSHQSGIPSYTGLPGFFEKQAAVARTPAEIIQLTDKMPLEFDPGTKFSYDNTGYILLGYIIEKVTGISYEAQLRKAILDPLGMKDTGFDHYTEILPHRADGYVYQGGKLQRAAFLEMSLPYAAGSLYSTVDDLLKWDQALYGTQVLSAASKEKMWTPNRSGYGYGWFIQTRHGEQVVEHGGGINGFNTVIMRIPAKKLVAIALSNVNTGSMDTIGAGLLALGLGKSAPALSHTKITLAPDAMKVFEGVYMLDADTKFTVKVAGDRLTAQAQGGGSLEFQPMSATRFFNDSRNIEIEFAKDGSSFTLHQDGRQETFKK